MLKAAILAPAAGLLVSFAVPAQAVTLAHATDPAPAADVQGTVTRLTAGVVRELGANLTYSNLVAQCGTDSSGVLSGVTKITDGQFLGALMPVNPPVDYRLPVSDPNLIVTLNKQVTDALGNMSVTAITVNALPTVTKSLSSLGLVHSIGVAHCDAAPARHHHHAAATISRHDLSGPPPAPVGDAATGVVNGLVNTAEGIAAQLTGITSVAPTGLVPAGVVPVGSVPVVGSVPAGTVPTGSVPVVGSVPAGSVPDATQIVPLGALFGGLPGLSSGIPIAGAGLPE